MNDEHLATAIAEAARLLARTLPALPAALAMMRDGELGQPSAASLEGGGRGGGGTSVTERAALQRAAGSDDALAARQRLDAHVRRLTGACAALAADVGNWQPRPPTTREARATEDGRDGCESCARWTGPDDVAWWSPVFIQATNVGGRLAHRMDLCRPCYDHVGRTKQLPTVDHLARRYARL